MGGEWRDVALEEVAADVTVGHVGPMASEYVERGIPFLRSQNVEPLRINDTDLKFITPAFHGRLKKSALPPASLMERFDTFAASLAEPAHRCSEESRTLAALRDTLLPKLISGELRIRDAEKFLETIV